MRRKSPTRTIDPLRELNVLRGDFSAFVVHHDEMQTHCFQEPRELPNPGVAGCAFDPGDNLVSNSGTHPELALTKVRDRARGPKVSVRCEIVHKASVVQKPPACGVVGTSGTRQVALWTGNGSLSMMLCSAVYVRQTCTAAYVRQSKASTRELRWAVHRACVCWC
jgi:hypothetical protein